MKTKEKTPFFSVVIPCFERPDDLRNCLKSINSENQKTLSEYEVIVSDDSRSDSCRKVIENEFSEVSWGKGKQTGPAGNRNAGVKRAIGEWIIFLDDDCVAQGGFLEAYANAIRLNPNVDIFEGRIFPDRPRKTWAEGCPANENGGLYWTSNLCVRKSFFLELNGLDEQFQVAYEDVDFAYRAKLSGAKFLFVWEAQACHPWRSVRQGGKNWKAKNYESGDFVRFLKKHNPSEPEFSFLGHFRNLARMSTTDFWSCIWDYKMRGMDILLFQMIVTVKSMFDILLHKKR